MKRCPKCAESIRDEALACRFCAYEYPQDRHGQIRAAALRRKYVGTGFVVVLIGALIYAMSSPRGAAPNGSPISAASGNTSTSRSKLQLDRFTWQSYGDSECKAAGRVQNIGVVSIDAPRLTLQFLKGSTLVGQVGRYSGIGPLAPGAVAPWSAYYDCPGKDATVDIIATQGIGEPLELIFTAK